MRNLLLNVPTRRITDRILATIPPRRVERGVEARVTETAGCKASSGERNDSVRLRRPLSARVELGASRCCFDAMPLGFSRLALAEYIHATAIGGSRPHKKLGCNAAKPVWSSRLPIPIRSPPSTYETFKRGNFTTHHASKFLILKRFD